MQHNQILNFYVSPLKIVRKRKEPKIYSGNSNFVLMHYAFRLTTRFTCKFESLKKRLVDETDKNCNKSFNLINLHYRLCSLCLSKYNFHLKILVISINI